MSKEVLPPSDTSSGCVCSGSLPPSTSCEGGGGEGGRGRGGEGGREGGVEGGREGGAGREGERERERERGREGGRGRDSTWKTCAYHTSFKKTER